MSVPELVPDAWMLSMRMINPICNRFLPPKLYAVFDVYDDEASALASFGK
jgi:hypothetical protein